MSQKAIEIRNLNKSFHGFKAVDNLELDVEVNECFGLLGPNGAGKSTTMKIIYGKCEPDQVKDSKINVFDLDGRKDLLKIKAISGVVPQQDNLDTELNVWDNLYVFSKLYGIKSSDAKKRITELLDFMELQEKAKSSLRELSGGMLRRLTIARALLNNPKLLILDEPTTGLDPQVRHLIWNKLRQLKEMGVTILLTTHYMEEAFQICDKLIIMDKGRKIIQGKPRELLKEHLEKNVMEVYGVCKNKEECKKYLKSKNIRFEIFKDTIFAYSNEIEALSEVGESLGGGEYYIRQSNLEDLFLKVTGRSLNELQ